MKKSTLAAGTGAVLALLTAGSVLAQTAPERTARADTSVSRAEFVDARIARLTAMDTNNDGSISADERRAAFEARRAERATARFTALDKDGNGSLSREEFTAPREARADRGDRGGRHQMRGTRGPRGDHAGPRGARGRDGGERGLRGEARGPQDIAEVRTRLTAQFDRLDANRDGTITVEERAAAREALRSERQSRRHERREGRRAVAPASPSASASE